MWVEAVEPESEFRSRGIAAAHQTTIDTLLPVGPPPMNPQSGAVIPGLGNPAVRMLDIAGSANGDPGPGRVRT